MAAMIDSSFDVDKLTYEIFSILENKFLFGGYDDPKLAAAKNNQQVKPAAKQPQQNFARDSKVRILSIDGGGATNGVLAAKSLAHLESCLRRKSGNPSASVSDYFDLVAGSGTGGVLAALLFTKGKDGRPMFTAEEALKFLVDNGRKLSGSPSKGMIRRVFRSGKSPADKLLSKTFGDSTLKDTLKSVLIPCYDLATRGAFVFSRADALEMDGYDFKMSDVCLATSADPTVVGGGAVEFTSVDKKTKIMAVDGGIAMNNPAAAAITHVLNNKQEFPLCNGVEDLLVVSLGNGESDSDLGNVCSTPARFTRVAGDGASDMVDQAVSMAFGQCRTRNYVRIQANGIIARKKGGAVMEKQMKPNRRTDIVAETEEMLAQKNVESVLFQGKKVAESTNLDKLDSFAGELIKEQERRKTSILPTVVLKQISPSPRTSSATTLSTVSSC